MRDLPLCRRIGPLWLLGFAGADAPAGFLRLLEAYRPDSLILFRDNLPGGLASLAPLRARLEEAADGPLDLYVDEEGGWITQLSARAWPSPRAQALAGIDAIEACHVAMGRELAALGVAAAIAPLADLDDGERNPVIGSRSFGADPLAAGEAVAAAVRGLRAGGVRPVLKHYPGHGDSLEDSHFTLPAVPGDRTQALIPFAVGLAAGAGAIMTAHLRIDDGLDERPATYRADILRDGLRERLGFAGLVITDALEMGGAAVLPACERGVAAFTAGSHLLTLARYAEGAEAMLEGVAAALRRGALREAAVEEALERRRAFIAGAGHWEPELEPDGAESPLDLAAIRAAGVFRPGGGDPDPIWDGGSIDLEFGPCGSWRPAEFVEALGGLPMRLVTSDDTLESNTYLYVGRSEVPAERGEELAERLPDGGGPAVLAMGPWAWTLPFPRRLASADGTPPGLRRLVERARGS